MSHASPARAGRPPWLGPFIGLEARRAARSRRTYVLRAVVLLILLFVVSIGLGWGTISVQRTSSSGLAELGRTTFWLFSITQLYLMSLMAPVLGAGVIAEERDQQTAGLLLLTPIRPLGLLAGKFLGKLLVLELQILAGLPLLALSLALGGVDWREALAAAALLHLTVIAAASAGLFAASLQLSTPGAAMATYLVLGVGWALTAIPAKLTGSPMTAMLALVLSSSAPGWALFWPPLATAGATTLACLLGAAAVFSRFTDDTAPPRQKVRRVRVVLAVAGVAGMALSLTASMLALDNRYPRLLSGGPFAAAITLLLTGSALALMTGIFLPAGRTAGQQRARPSPPGAGPAVWDNPVAWREWYLRGRTRAVQIGIDVLCLLAVLGAMLNAKRISTHDLASVASIIHSLSYWWLMLLGAQAFVAERRARTLELLAPAPLAPSRVVVGKLLGIGRRCLVPLGLSYVLISLSKGSLLGTVQMVAQDLCIVSLGLAVSLWARTARVAYGTTLALVTLQSFLTLISVGRSHNEPLLLAARLVVTAAALGLAVAGFRRWAAR